MTSTAPPAAPKGLGRRGRRFWRTVQAAYVLDPAETEVLVEVCRLLDRSEQLQELLDRDGLEVTGSTGQTRVHPALGQQRALQALLAKLLAQLDLPDDDGAGLASPTTARARTAARSRWKHNNQVKELRRLGPPPGA
jgi:P27 family predicted phage terminase small subunit